MEGLRGDDTYIVQGRWDVVIEREGEGNDTVRTTGTHFLGANTHVETLRAHSLSSHASIDLIGNKFANTIIGNDGDNVLDGGKGDDTLLAREGADVIVGGRGGDDMYAGRDNDKDKFLYIHKYDSGKSGSTIDRIFDFDRKNGDEKVYDRIQLNRFDADTRPGHQDLRFVDEFSKARGSDPDGQLMVQKAGDDVKVLIDLDGNNKADMVIRVMDIDTLHKADFIL